MTKATAEKNAEENGVLTDERLSWKPPALFHGSSDLSSRGDRARCFPSFWEPIGLQYLNLGQSELSASRITLGAWALGGWNWGGTDEAQSIRAIHAALDAGVNTIDTAPIYGFGRSEEIVGKAIANRRDDVIIATKCGMLWNTNRGKLFFHSGDDEIRGDGDKAIHIYQGPDALRADVEASLQRLGVDTIDLLQTHWQDETTPLADTIGEMERLQQEGKIRWIGACNASLEQLDQYRQSPLFVSDQEKYSMLDRAAETNQLPYVVQHGLAFFAYSPMANGLLTGKMGPEREFPPGDMRRVRDRFSVESRTAVAEFLAQIEPIANQHNATLAQLVLAWTLAQPGVSHLLVGARTPQQAVRNAAAADITLAATEVQDITAAIGDLGDRVGSSAPKSR